MIAAHSLSSLADSSWMVLTRSALVGDREKWGDIMDYPTKEAVMLSPEIVSGKRLAKAIRDLSKGSARVWIASPFIGRDAHNVFDASFVWATDKRLLIDIRSGYIDRRELQYLNTWAAGEGRTLRGLHAKLYLFDSAAIITSANLSLTAFERNLEVGVIVRGESAKQVRQLISILFSRARGLKLAEIDRLSARARDGDQAKSRTARG